MAQLLLGAEYSKGIGVPRDLKEAFKWNLKAGEQGIALAQSFLGEMYRKGIGVNQDYKESVMWYRKSAEQGDNGAQTNL